MREAVLEQYEAIKDDDLDPDLILPGVAGAPFYKTSKFTLATLGSTSTRHDLEECITTFQPTPARSSTSSPSATGSSGSTSTICSASWSRSSVASTCTWTVA